VNGFKEEHVAMKISETTEQATERTVKMTRKVCSNAVEDETASRHSKEKNNSIC